VVQTSLTRSRQTQLKRPVASYIGSRAMLPGRAVTRLAD
jgi:hypothetical protein